MTVLRAVHCVGAHSAWIRLILVKNVTSLLLTKLYFEKAAFICRFFKIFSQLWSVKTTAMKKLLSLSFLLLICASAFAQAETPVILPVRNDSLPLMKDSLDVHFIPQTPDLQNTVSLINEPLFADSISSPLLLQPGGYYANFVLMPSDAPNPLHWGDFNVTGLLEQSYYPGLMDVSSGSLGLQYSHGRFSAYAGGVVNKYGFYRGLYTQKGITANLTYMFAPRWSATLFGTYYRGNGLRMANGMPMSPAMLGFYNVSRFGGYVDYRISEHFGVQAGAQMVQQIGPRTQYEFQPIVTPYFKVGKIAIGLPVGQIMHGIIKDQMERRDRRHSGPIPPR